MLKKIVIVFSIAAIALLPGVMGVSQSPEKPEGRINEHVRRDVVTKIPNTMVWPIPESEISSHFGDRPQLGYHYGLDLGGDYNTPIISATEGTVIFAGWNYGWEIRIQDPTGRYVYLYAHLNRIDVAVGQYVQMGQSIGLMGSTGYSTGPHLHFEIRDNGTPVDPYPILKDQTQVKYY